MQLAALVVAAGLFGSTSAFAALDSGKTLWDSCNDLNDTSKQSYCLGYVATHMPPIIMYRERIAR
jgi:hypothetical protein